MTHCVFSKESDVPFIASIKENGSTILVPVVITNQVTLDEGVLVGKAEVVHLYNSKTGKNGKIFVHYMDGYTIRRMVVCENM